MTPEALNAKLLPRYVELMKPVETAYHAALCDGASFSDAKVVHKKALKQFYDEMTDLIMDEFIIKPLVEKMAAQLGAVLGLPPKA